MNPSSFPQINNAEAFRKFIEVEVLKIIHDLAEKGETPKEKVQSMAQTALDLIQPDMTLEEMYMNAVKLDDNFPELAPVVFSLMKEYEQKYEKRAVGHVSQLVHEGKYEEAQEMVKKVLQFKMAN